MDLHGAKKFFEHLKLPKLSEEDVEYLERPITLEEVNKTIQSLPMGKTPGTDGIPSEFYKQFSEDLGPEMLKTFRSAIDMGKLPPSMTESIITLILKKGKDPLECGSYRPISLLCCDEKLFTKIFAIRINNVITSIIHPDQRGFVKGRTSADSLRCLLHLIWHVKDSDTPTAALSLDTNNPKAFDHVSWSYLIFALQEFGFGLDKMKLAVLVDRSLAAQQYTPQLEYYLKSFISNTTGNDLIDITLVDEKRSISTGEQTASISRTWNFITNHKALSPMPQSWDVPLYESITKLLNNFRNRAVIVFTSGEEYQSAFSDYSIDVVETYASQNNIPIYVINFSEKNRDLWEPLAKNTHGQYFDANKNAREILTLHSIIKDSPNLEYLIEFDSRNYSDAPGLWVETVLDLERFGISGVTTDGFYIPERRRMHDVNLQESFFPNE